MTAHEKLCEELLAVNLCPKQSYADLGHQADNRDERVSE